ncbi:DUF3182 family protein [Bordetella hinzii]|uniref:DUF3182 domain-containing protein n=2 Tax=Bordetella hinzii TaxID=103855 RepID=A0AAN1RYV0_9BORD|nr:DUF3182 family protein [Bordetella hinzii]AKQ60268.1 hypothetical protein ACR55_02400 [Bordetella hinzii]AZW18661.1 DUF3182 domain-containing protein [Bordetella hinzii]KXA70615.1 hypothetical protein AXA74_22855 [Bordetella hinzii LMG 13501]MBZ0077369.1 DUF3182 family protein [Bordetella hinzii]MBZ0081752.1 DUF3182 family protein [Bordetella hinzii]
MTPSALSAPAWVVAYPRRRQASEHEIATQLCLARKLSELLQCRLLEPYRPSRQRSHDRCYYVPDRSLVGSWRTQRLGIRDARQLYGGVVPRAFVATKAISHGLWRDSRAAPPGWARGLAAELGDAVLRGYTVFCAEDAWQAGLALLRDGPVRLKSPFASAGRGQSLVRDSQALREALAEPGLCERGLVLEENLDEPMTYSVGWCEVGEHRLAYIGTQELTVDNHGAPVYGGSRLRCLRGGPGELAAADLPPAQRRAVELALRYDRAVNAAYPQLYASRRNYDVAIGADSRAGVLEQSWRAGGASIAELAALRFLDQQPEAREVHAYTRERYGAPDEEPPRADLVYRGEDSAVGHITKSGGILGAGDGGAE